MRTLFKGLLLSSLVAYLALPFYLYGFTPMGASVMFLFRQAIPRGAGSLASAQPGLPPAGSGQPNSKPAKDQPLTVLLLGYGGPGHDGPYLTDSLVLAIANPGSKSLSFLSIPRDTLVKLPLGQRGEIWSKINTAYAYGLDQVNYKQRPDRYKGPQAGGLLAKDTVAAVTGIPVRYYLALDFNTFRNLIDEVGGVDLTAPAAFASLYPKEDDPSIDSDWTVVRFAAGKQHMSGERALEYARAREAIENMAEGSDFARSRRQRQVMQAFKDKVMSPGGFLHIPKLLAIAKDQIDTDFSVPTIGDMQKLIADWRGLKVTEAALTSDNYLTSASSTESGYYLSPVAGQGNWTSIHAFVQVLVDDPALAEEMARTKVVVRNASGRPAEGKEVRDKLLARGFAVAPVETVPVQPASRIDDLTGGANDALIEAIKTALGEPDIPVKIAGDQSPTIAIVLGQTAGSAGQTVKP